MKLKKEMEDKGLRISIDDRAEKNRLQNSRSQTKKNPLYANSRRKEVEDRLVSVNKRDEGDIGQFKLEEFINMAIEEVENKK